MKADPITDRVAQILAVDREVFVPLERLYQILKNEGVMGHINIDMFEWLLTSDDRFEFIENLEDEIFEGLIDPEVDAELEGLGFFAKRPLVKLGIRQATVVDMMDSLLRQLKRMNESLENAWRSQDNDPEAREGLLHVLMMGDMLERQVRQLLLDELALETNLLELHEPIRD
jgi:hypothetical protein